MSAIVAWPSAWFALALALCGSSCGLLSGSNQAIVEQQARDAKFARLQSDVMRLADQAILDLGSASRRFSRELDTPEAQRQALSWNVTHTNRVLGIASNPKPLAALVDLLLYASVQRIFHEEYWLPKVHGEADRPLVESFQRVEASCWESLGAVLDEKQLDALRAVLLHWREENPDLSHSVAVEAPSFTEIAAPIRGEERVLLVSDLIDLVSLDPLAGLEPAVREVVTTRQLAERVFFYARHMPRLLQQELELLSQRTLNLPEVRATVEGAVCFSRAAESLAATAALLPETLRAERAGLVADLERARAPLQALLEQSRETLEAGTRTAASITSGIAALDAFVSRTGGADQTPEGSGAPARPFDVGEYGEAATRIGAAARELSAAIGAADEHLPGAQALLDEAALRVDRSVDHAYGRALGLLLWAAALLVVALLAVRLIWSIPQRFPARISARQSVR